MQEIQKQEKNCHSVPKSFVGLHFTSSSCRGANIDVGYGSLGRLSVDSSYKQRVYLGDSIWSPPQQEDKSPWMSALIECAKQYCYTAVLHGVKYLAEPRRSHLERFSWSIVLLSLVGVALHLLYVTSIADLSSPLIINLESSNYPIWNFNFPAVTLCPSSKLNKTASEKWARQMQRPPGMTESELVDLLPNLLHMVDFAESPESEVLNRVLEQNNVSAHHLYLELSVQCRDFLIRCRLNDVVQACEHIFKTIRTTEGYCCSFNYFGVSSQYLLNRYHVPSDITPKAPLRVSTSGKNSGLSVLLRTKGDTFGTLMSSQGVKVLIHVATNYPDHLAIARLVQPGHGEHFALNPALVAASDDLRSVKSDTRNCYFFDEKALKGFQQYSYKSCIFNCRTSFFVELCGCVPFYYPTFEVEICTFFEKNRLEILFISATLSNVIELVCHADGIRTCSLKDVQCLTQFKYQIQALRKNLSLVLDQDDSAPCDCKPQCNELSYEVATSTYILFDELKTSKYKKIDSFEELSEVNVYFKALFGTKYQRIDQSTTYQMLANFGGLLGMFMGFSFISVFEILYCFSLRVFFRMYLNKKDKTEVEAY